MNLHAFLQACWNKTLFYLQVRQTHPVSLITLAAGWDFLRRNPDRKKALEYFLYLRLRGVRFVMDLRWCGLMWFHDLLPVAPFGDSCIVLRSLIWRKKDFKQPSLSHTSMDKMFFVRFSITPTGFLSLPWRNFQRLRRNFTVGSLVVFLSWIKRFKAISLCWCLIDWFIP